MANKFVAGQKVYRAMGSFIKQYTVTQVGRGQVGVIDDSYGSGAGYGGPRETFYKEEEFFETKQAAIIFQQEELLKKISLIFAKANEEALALAQTIMDLAKLRVKIESRAEAKKAQEEIQRAKPLKDLLAEEEKKNGRKKKSK